MGALNENLAAIAGNLKVVYGTDLNQVLPDAALIQKEYPMSMDGKFPAVGDYFSALVALQLPWGFSYLGNGSEGTTTNYLLGDALAGQTKPAQIYANTTVLVDNLQYQILDRASSNGGKQSVMSAMSYTGKQMALNIRNVLELQILHGREGIGAASAPIATLTVTFDATTTSPGILSLLIGARVEWFQSNLTTARTAHDNTNYLTVSAVDVSVPTAPTITVVATGTTAVATITTGDVMFLGGSRGVSVAAGDTAVPFYEQIGLGSQLATITGTQFGIDKTNIGWKANQLGTIGQFSPSALMSAAALSQGRGGQLGEYFAAVDPGAWGVLNSSLATNEVYNNPAGFSMSKKTGTDDIVVYHGGIKVNVMSHPFQKRGKFYLWPKAEYHRIGSTDVTFAIPGRAGGEEYFFPVNGTAAMQRQCRADFQGVLLQPPSGVVGTGITF